MQPSNLQTPAPVASNHETPMKQLVKNIHKFDYRTAGIYIIKGVKSIETPNIYMDFHIFIPTIQDLSVHKKLLELIRIMIEFTLHNAVLFANSRNCANLESP